MLSFFAQMKKFLKFNSECNIHDSLSELVAKALEVQQNYLLRFPEWKNLVQI